MTGPANDPEIMRYRKAMDEAAATPAAPATGFMDRLRGMFGMGAPTAAPTGAIPNISPIGTLPGGNPLFVPPPGSPVGLPTPQVAPAPAAASPFKEGAFIKNKKTGKTYRVVNGVPVEESPETIETAPPEETGDTEEEM